MIIGIQYVSCTQATAAADDAGLLLQQLLFQVNHTSLDGTRQCVSRTHRHCRQSALHTSKGLHVRNRRVLRLGHNIHTGIAVLADVIIQTPTNTAAAQNTVQNLLTSVPEPVKEAPERLIIAASLIAVAVGGYLLRERTRSN